MRTACRQQSDRARLEQQRRSLDARVPCSACHRGPPPQWNAVAPRQYAHRSTARSFLRGRSRQPPFAVPSDGPRQAVHVTGTSQMAGEITGLRDMCFLDDQQDHNYDDENELARDPCQGRSAMPSVLIIGLPPLSPDDVERPRTKFIRLSRRCRHRPGARLVTC